LVFLNFSHKNNPLPNVSNNVIKKSRYCCSA
jgi:hypothetical protein